MDSTPENLIKLSAEGARRKASVNLSGKRTENATYFQDKSGLRFLGGVHKRSVFFIEKI